MPISLITPVAKSLELQEIEPSREYKFGPFDLVFLDFLNKLSGLILSHPSLRTRPEYVSLGFWLRKSNLNRIYEENKTSLENDKYITSPVGLVLHICPGNVDTMFIYSLALSLLMGNKNIVKISSRAKSEELEELFEVLNQLINTIDFAKIKDYIQIINYNHDEEISKHLVAISDAKILWGGDDAVNYFKSFESKARAKSIEFADRCSLSLVNAGFYNNASDTEKKQFVEKFFNDSYVFDQKGCSSPQIIYVIGNEKEYNQFNTDFYSKLSEISFQKYTNDISSLSSLKLNKIFEDIIDDKAEKVISKNNFVVLIELNPEIEINNIETCGGGYFYLSRIDNLSDLYPKISLKVQSVSYYGISKDDIMNLCNSLFANGIDRIVPAGEALSFNYIWDGYNLINELGRKKAIK